MYNEIQPALIALDIETRLDPDRTELNFNGINRTLKVK